MPIKAHPFKAENWQEVVIDGIGIMHDKKIGIIHSTKRVA
jgi:hypothetical protein